MTPVLARRRDYLAVVEAAYALDRSEQDWVQGIAEAALPIIDAGHGALTYVYDARAPAVVHVGSFAQAGGMISIESDARAFVASLSPVETRRFLCASPPTELMHRILPVNQQSSEILTRRVSVMDALGIRGHNPDERGCVISAPSPGPYDLKPRTRASLDRVALHLAAAFRLRSSASGRDALSQADAVFSKRGKLEHLAPSSQDHSGLLSRAVAGRLLGQSLRSEAPERALELWSALFAGRWSVVDHIDTDGKRFLLARRNAVELDSPTTLTARERLVALYASWGHPSKLIAYELGLSQSTVSSLLQSSLRKLKLGSRAELVQLFTPAALGRQGA